MLQALIAGLEGSALSEALRSSIWAYPLVNALHILGIALLVGAITVFDLRMLGLWPRAPLGALAPPLLATARGGFALAVLAGLLLFIARPADYAWHPLFRIKLALIALALVNIALLHRSSAWATLGREAHPAFRVRLSAALSLLLWLSALLAGRLIGYR